MQDPQHNNATPHALAPVSLGATGSGGKVSKIIDRAGFGGPVQFVLSYGTIGATNATVAVTVKEGDVTGSMSTASSSVLIGTTAAAGITATAARASGVSKNVNKSITYNGLKRFCQVTMAPTICGGIIASATAILRGARVAPVTVGG
jgi:hypothetical protein